MTYYYTEFHNYIEILNLTITQFMDYNPPCKECLVKIMCMKLSCKNLGNVFQYLSLEIKNCNRLMDFIIYNKDFDSLSKE